MQIGMVTACYNPVVNGVTQMVTAYKERLQRDGHGVEVFTLGPQDPAGDELGVIRSPAFPLGNSGYYFAPRYSTIAQRLLQQMDVIHCHHLLMGVELAHRYVRCPIIYTNHTRYDLYADSYTPLPRSATDALMRKLWPRITDYCDVVVAPSPSAGGVMRRFGVRQPIKVIENGVNLERFQHPTHPYRKSDLGISESAFLLGYVGRLSSEKGVDGLLRQFAKAMQREGELHLLIVGTGPQQRRLKRLAGDLGISGRVRFTGAAPSEEVPGYLAALDAFVTASVSEMHPLTVIEAMASGLPVVAVSSPGLVDLVVDGTNGLLVDSSDAGLATAMVKLARNPEWRQQLGDQALLSSQRYDIERTVARTLALYRRLLQQKRESFGAAAAKMPSHDSENRHAMTDPSEGAARSNGGEEAGHGN